MAKRDPEKTARNKRIKQLTKQINTLMPKVSADTGIKDILSLNGRYGSKHADYIDIKEEVISSPEQFISLYFQGFKKIAEGYGKNSNHYYNLEMVKEYSSLKEILFLFLTRTYLKNIESLSKVRPATEEAFLWIGQNNANYGIFITPRFNKNTRQWENDKSEIRHFKQAYWSLGHILETGLCVPSQNKRIRFRDIEEYLNFFENVIVRNSGSIYEKKLAELYSHFVLTHSDPLRIPLLIPELRYDGIKNSHRYRLDFCIINPESVHKIGIELSPWSSHGTLKGIKGLNQKQINEIAKGNYEKEMNKHKKYFLKYGISTLIFTDSDLKNIGNIFESIKIYLEPPQNKNGIQYQILDELFDLGI